MQRPGSSHEEDTHARPRAERYAASALRRPGGADKRRRNEEPSGEPAEEPNEDLVEEELVEEEPSLARLMGELVADVHHLARKELELAKIEFQGEIEKLKQSAASFTLGAAMAAGGGLLVLFMAVYLIAGAGVQLWVAYLIVGGASLLIGGILLAVGRSRARDVDLMPRETIDTLRKEAQWIREQSPSSKRSTRPSRT